MSIIDSIMSRPAQSQYPAQAPPVQAPGVPNVPQSYYGSRQNDGYQSFGGSVVRNTLVGAGMGALISLPLGPISLPVGAAAGAAIGAGSALIRHPRAAAAVGDGMKAGMAGATGGALVGFVTPMGPLVGAVAGAGGGFMVGTLNGLLKKYAGGRYSIEARPTPMSRAGQGAKLGALSGAALGAGVGAFFGGIGAVPGALIGGAIGAVGGGIYGFTTGGVDAVTGAKGAMLKYPGGGSPGVPGSYPGQVPGQYPGQIPGQFPGQYPGQMPYCPPQAA